MNVTDRDIIPAPPGKHLIGTLSSWAWTLHLVCLCALVGLLVAVNEEAIVAAVRVWWVSPTYSHCFFIIPISAYFVWRRRQSLAMLRPHVELRALWLFIPLIFVSLAGKLAHINELEQLAFVGMLQAIIIAVLGTHIYRRILFPSLFLFFLVPMGEYLIGPLQRFTTQFISTGLTLIGIPHYTEVNVIQLSNGDYEVAEACAGLRFLIATVAVGALFAHLTYRKWYKILLFLAATLVLPTIANGFRALGIVLLGYWSNNRIAHGVDHIIYGWGFLVAILMALMLIGARYADPLVREQRAGLVKVPAITAGKFGLTVLLSAVAISIAPMLVYWQNHRVPNISAASFSAPLKLPSWHTGAPSGRWSPDYALPDARLAFSMQKTGFSPVDVFVSYYAGESGGPNLVSSSNKMWSEDTWHPLSQDTIVAALGGRKLHLNEAVIASAGRRRILWWTYWSARRFTPYGLDVKLDRLRQALMGSGGSALIALSAPVDIDTDQARRRLREALVDLGPVIGRLEAADRH